MASLSDSDLRHCLERCSQLRIPVIGLVPEDHLADLDESLGLDDFVVSPPSPPELVVRARRVLKRSKSPDADNVIRNGDLDIDPTSYEVSLKGRPVNLRFKEYELLRLLATNPGRVYTRESLLSQIWGYDYFGGTRTVDVHIRRLRSKIEDADHSFIETIWNVGYRFRDVSQSR
jgi:DNA-binding response OmpR family regulator